MYICLDIYLHLVKVCESTQPRDATNRTAISPEKRRSPAFAYSKCLQILDFLRAPAFSDGADPRSYIFFMVYNHEVKRVERHRAQKSPRQYRPSHASHPPGNDMSRTRANMRSRGDVWTGERRSCPHVLARCATRPST